jgi:hypothetical protein
MLELACVPLLSIGTLFLPIQQKSEFKIYVCAYLDSCIFMFLTILIEKSGIDGRGKEVRLNSWELIPD